MRRRAAAYAAILFALNLYVSWRLFRLEYSHFMSSIEGAYIGISRHILMNWSDLTWWPAWYSGIPFRNAYPPLLHMLVALTAKVGGFSVARAHHIATAGFYCIGPVFAYLMLRRFSGKPFTSFCAALLYTVISPSGLLIRQIAADLDDPLRPRRLSTLVAYGDGPHIAGIALFPLAIWSLDRALVRRGPLDWGLAAICFIAVVYTNWLAAFALAAMVFCYLLAGRPWRDWALTAAFGVMTYCVACPWAPPSMIRTIQFNAQTIGGDFRESYKMLLRFTPIMLVGLAALRLGMRRTPAYQQMLAMFTFLMCAPTLGWFWFGFSILPQPDRYQLEMDLGITLLMGIGVSALVERAPRRAMHAVILIFFGLVISQLHRGQRYARGLVEAVDIRTTLEYRSARWLGEYMPGARVLVPGTVSFWLSAFADNAELGGGFAQGVINWENRVAEYEIVSGGGTKPDSIDIEMLWLHAFGIQAIEVGGKGTREYYRAFAMGDKFRGRLPELWREGDDAIYRIPSRNSELAHVMLTSQLVDRAPVNGADVVQVQRYVDAITDPTLPDAKFVWHTNHSAEILANMQPNHVAAVQITYDPGWHAIANGRSAKVRPDGLGLFAVEPQCNGECRIELWWDGGGREMTVCKGLRASVLVSWLVWTIQRRFRRARRLAS